MKNSGTRIFPQAKHHRNNITTPRNNTNTPFLIIPHPPFTSRDRLNEAKQELITALSCPTTAVNALSDLHKLHDAFVNNALTQLDWARAIQNWAAFLMRPELQRVEEASGGGGGVVVQLRNAMQKTHPTLHSHVLPGARGVGDGRVHAFQHQPDGGWRRVRPKDPHAVR